jgi:hypothetical protein
MSSHLPLLPATRTYGAVNAATAALSAAASKIAVASISLWGKREANID